MSDVTKQARERRRLIALYDETQNENFLRAALCLDLGGGELSGAEILAMADQKNREDNGRLVITPGC